MIDILEIPSTEAQNNFGRTIDKAIHQPIVITRSKRKVVYMITPEALQDMIDSISAIQAEAEGMLSIEETDNLLNSIRNA
jgi:PHD/YefM family antitoxin component YafN of YafNO toxin-antitoxin module